MTSRRARRGAAIFALCLGTLPATGCSALSGSVQRPASAASVKPAAATGPPVVMFLGDSYTVGERGSLPENTYASAAARLLGWQVILAGRGGTGFVAMGALRQPFAALYESQLGWRPAPDLLIVSGGHNDWRYPPQQIAGAARELLGRARSRWPGTRQAVIGPIWGNDAPPATALAVRDTLRNLAAELGIAFIDPIGGRWITGSRATGSGNAPAFIRGDGVHPTVEGHRYMAARLTEDIKRLGLAHPARKR